MFTPLIEITLLAFLGSIAGLIGGVIFLLKKDWAKRLCCYAIPFAAGVLISVALVHTIPESLDVIGEGAMVVVLATFVLAFVFEELFAGLHHHEDRKHTMLKGSVPLVLFGDTVHNLIDGIAIAGAYLVEPMFGLVVALATFLHETPHEIGDFGILYSAGWKRKKILLANTLSALTTFVGAYLTYFIAFESQYLIGYALAVAGGVFLYLGASDFLPEVSDGNGKVPPWKELSVFVFGAVLMYLMTFIIPAH
jgi:zinc and cadmium transporter